MPAPDTPFSSSQGRGVDVLSLRLADVVETMPDGVYITDVNRRIVMWNAAAEAITGWSKQRVLGSSCRDNLLVHVDKEGHPLCGEEFCPLQRAMATGRSQCVPMLVFAQHRTGRRIPVEVSTAPLRDTAGQIVGGIEVFRDATALHDGLRAAAIIQQHTLECRPPDGGPVEVDLRHTAVDVVGGDFLRVERLDGHRYVAMVAEVMGQGLPAALFSMQLRVLWDDLREVLPTPSAFLGRLNNRLRGLTGRDSYFATACLAVVDTASGRVTCAAAGHPAPVLRRATGAFEKVHIQGAALGMLPGASYEESVGEFAIGDTLLLFTDGAIEVANPEGMALGVEGLVRLCGQLDTDKMPDLERLEAAILQHAQGIRLDDDLTLVSLRRRA
ncbi:MAG: SpoIIE family protein phosphatase [Lentisphaerae bacterium]|nr:SpoIIE family protein phosphatase [Lentisphaerota bacterium]